MLQRLPTLIRILTPGLQLFFEVQDAPPALGGVGGGDQPGGPGPDDDGVECGCDHAQN